jgi:hypothetical protein
LDVSSAKHFQELSMSQSKVSNENQAGVPQNPDRRSFLKRASLGSAALAGSAAFVPLLKVAASATETHSHSKSGGLTEGDREILVAAEIAEALAVTTYTNIINTAPFFGNLASDDQGYLMAARHEEMSHYLLEQSATGQPSPFTKFYYPEYMFFDPQTTLNVLVTLEDAFIAAYLVGVRRFSTPDLRVTSARIMGIESDHRTLARVIGPGIAESDGGPIENITGFAGVAESVDPPNNNGYERTLCWDHIAQAVAALTPFADANAAAAAGFDSGKAYDFQPFTPVLPNALGAFISFKGC